MREAMDELHRLWMAEDFAAFARFQEVRTELGGWGDALPYSRDSIRVGLDELQAFFAEYLALLARYQRDDADAPPGARTVQTRFIAFPDTEEDRPED